MGVVLMTANSNADISTFTTFATQLLTWLVTTFQTVLNFMIANPICFVGLVMVLIVAAIGTLRHLIGGKAKKDSSPQES